MEPSVLLRYVVVWRLLFGVLFILYFSDSSHVISGCHGASSPSYPFWDDKPISPHQQSKDRRETKGDIIIQIIIKKDACAVLR
jgi:hypothetical protein